MKTLKIGRQEGNDIVINNSAVSRLHATLYIDNNYYFIKDEGSRNGTWVNGEKVTERHLKTNDILKVADELIPWMNYIKDPVKPGPEIEKTTATPVAPAINNRPAAQKKKTSVSYIAGSMIIIVLIVLIITFFTKSQMDELRMAATWNTGTQTSAPATTSITFNAAKDKRGTYSYKANTSQTAVTGTWQINTESKLVTLTPDIVSASNKQPVPNVAAVYKYTLNKDTLSMHLNSAGTAAANDIIFIKQR